jgi:hypothetical protein
MNIFIISRGAREREPPPESAHLPNEKKNPRDPLTRLRLLSILGITLYNQYYQV